MKLKIASEIAGNVKELESGPGTKLMENNINE